MRIFVATLVRYGMVKIKLALQAAIYIPSSTQGDALGWYKLALQADLHYRHRTQSIVQ